MYEWIETAGAGTALAYLVEVTGKSILVLLFAGIIISLFRRGSAADRHRIWFAALFGVILFPLLTAVLPSWSGFQNPTWLEALRTVDAQLQEAVAPDIPDATILAMQGMGLPAISAFPEPPVGDPMLQGGSETAPAQIPVVTEQDGGNGEIKLATNPVISSLSAFWGSIQKMHWTTMLFWMWLTGAVIVLAQLITGAFGVLFLVKRATPIRDPEWMDLADEIGDRFFLKREVLLLRSQETSMPMTWGGLSPVVLLPADADSWSDERKRCVLTHEFAHIKRWDCATQGIAQLACAVYWFNPVVWMAAKRLRVEREKACDDYVVASGTKASNYAGHLLEIASAMKATFLPPLGAVSMARPSQLEGRVLAILDPNPRKHHFGRAARVVISALVIGIVFPLAAMVPYGSDAQRSNDPDAMISAEEMVMDETQVPVTISESATETIDEAPEPGYTMIPAQVDTNRTKKKRLRLMQAFIKVLDDKDPQIRRNAAYMLGELGLDEAVEPLEQALLNDSVNRVREQAAWALGEIGSDSAVGALAQAMDDPDARVRKQVVWALAEIESLAALDAMIDRLNVETDDDAREMLAWALGDLEDERAVPALASAFESESDPRIKKKIVWALGNIESIQAAPVLRIAARDSDEEVRSGALWALSQLEDVESVPVFREALKDSDPDIRRRAVRALADLGDRESVDALIEVARDTDGEVRRTAIWALGELDDERAIDALVQASKDPDTDIRRHAIRSLGEFEGTQVEAAIINALSDEDEMVREYAAGMCSEFESDRVVESLGEALFKDTSRSVRRRSAMSLSNIGTDAALDILEEALDHEDVEVRRAATWAITRSSFLRVDLGDHFENNVSIALGNVAVVAAEAGLDIAEAAVSALAAVAPEIGDIVSDAVDESLQEIDWDAISEQATESIRDSATEIRMELLDDLIHVAKTRPNSREGRDAMRMLRRSSHPKAKAFIEDRK